MGASGMASLIDRIRAGFGIERERPKPMSEQGVAGFAVYGGHLNSTETNSKLFGGQRWETASDLLANISIIAASVRFMANLVSRPAWSWEPEETYGGVGNGKSNRSYQG